MTQPRFEMGSELMTILPPLRRAAWMLLFEGYPWPYALISPNLWCLPTLHKEVQRSVDWDEIKKYVIKMYLSRWHNLTKTELLMSRLDGARMTADS